MPEGKFSDMSTQMITACPDATYGHNCNQSCGYCKDNAQCDKVNGSCYDGCAPGWRTDLCTTGELINKSKFVAKYSRLSLSRLRFTRITAYLKVQLWFLF